MGLIYLDSCLLIYAYEQHPVFGQAVLDAMAREGPERFAISPMTKMECLVKPMRTANLVLQQHYERGFGAFHLLAMSENVFLLAAQLRARFGLRPPDALHLACALHHGCAEIWTNDDRLAQAGHGLARNVLRVQ